MVRKRSIPEVSVSELMFLMLRNEIRRGDLVVESECDFEWDKEMVGYQEFIDCTF